MPSKFWTVLIVGIVAGPSCFGATIYRCKSYEDGMFWSSGPCSTHSALIDRIATVPDGMPFQQQVNVAEQALGTRAQAVKTDANEREKAEKCYQINAEFNRIWRKYENGQFVPAELVGPDQIRWKELKTLKAQSGCPKD